MLEPGPLMWALSALTGQRCAAGSPGYRSGEQLLVPSSHIRSGVSLLFSLQLVHRTLVPASQSATAGHMTLLKQKVLTAILRRLDITLFQKLVQGEHSVSVETAPSGSPEGSAIISRVLPVHRVAC